MNARLHLAVTVGHVLTNTMDILVLVEMVLQESIVKMVGAIIFCLYWNKTVMKTFLVETWGIISSSHKTTLSVKPRFLQCH